MSEVTFHDHDSVGGALEAAGATKNPGNVHSALKRVYRDAVGDPAEPAASDYLMAVSGTDGAVCVELARDEPLIVRGGQAVPDGVETDYQRYDEGGAEPVVVDVPSQGIPTWVAQWGATLGLHDDHIAKQFAAADSVDGDSDIDLQMQRARARSYRRA
jgi:hypothetical protein